MRRSLDVRQASRADRESICFWSSRLVCILYEMGLLQDLASILILEFSSASRRPLHRELRPPSALSLSSSVLGSFIGFASVANRNDVDKAPLTIDRIDHPLLADPNPPE